MVKEVERRVYLRQLEEVRDRTELVKVITGMRRSGKTVLMEQFIRRLADSGVARGSIVHMNFESDGYRDITDYGRILDAVRKADAPGRVYVFLDEVQRVRDWEKAVNSLQTDFDADVYITGSNAFLLSSDLSTYISGRYVEIRVLPLSFAEFLELHPGDRDERFMQYVRIGSLPIVDPDGDEQVESNILRGVFDTVILKDVLRNVGSADSTVLEDIAGFLYSNMGNITSRNNIAVTLGESQKDVHRFVDALQKTFLFYKAERYDIRGRRLLDSLEKYYPSDTGMRNAVLGISSREDDSRLLEGIVFMELLRRGYDVCVGKFGSDEVDFTARRGHDIEYYQVTLTMLPEDAYNREVRSLRAIKDSRRKYVLSMDRFVTSLPDGLTHMNLVAWLLGEVSAAPTRNLPGLGWVPREYLSRFLSGGSMYCFNRVSRRGFRAAASDMGFLGRYFGSETCPMSAEVAGEAEVISEGERCIAGLLDGSMSDHGTMRSVLVYAGLLRLRSPGYVPRMGEDPSAYRETFCGMPLDRFGCAYVEWREDTLVTCDNMVVGCDLADIAFERRSERMEGFLFPLSPRGLLMIFPKELVDSFRGMFGARRGLINPSEVNRLMAEGATALVFSNDPSNPVFEALGRNGPDSGDVEVLGERGDEGIMRLQG